MLTNRRQQQALADLLHGLEPEVFFEQFSEPYRSLWREICHLLDLGYDRYDIQQELARLKLREGDDQLAATIDAVQVLEPGATRQYTSLQEIGPALPQTTWLWPAWLPRGLLTLLAAWPGVGKTYFALDLARRVIANLPAPDGVPLNLTGGAVIFVDAEDFLPDVYERATVWGMALDRFYPLRRPPRDLMDLSRAEYQDPLIEMCYDLRPDLVIIDSLSLVNVRGENNIEDLRDVLGFFVELAGAFDLGLLLIHHLRKPGKGLIQPVTVHDLRGSGHLVAMARSIIALDVIRMGPEEDPNGPRQLKVLKKNRGKYPQPLSVQYHSAETNADVAVLEYGPLDLFQQVSETLMAQCAEWLLELLTELGPLPFNEIIVYADEVGFKRGTVAKARRYLGAKIVDTKGQRQPGNQWALADNAPIVAPAPNGTVPAVERCAAWLQETLQAGPRSYCDLREQARQAGFSENTLQAARKRCTIILDTIGPRRQGNQWRLAET
jgi:hypothetical protein